MTARIFGISLVYQSDAAMQQARRDLQAQLAALTSKLAELEQRVAAGQRCT